MKKILAVLIAMMVSSLLVAQPGAGQGHQGQQHPGQHQNVSLKIRAQSQERFNVSVDGHRQPGGPVRHYTFTDLRPGQHEVSVELTSPARASLRTMVDLRSREEEYVVKWRTTGYGTELVIESSEMDLYTPINGNGGGYGQQPPANIQPPANGNGSYRDGYQAGYRDGWRDAMNASMSSEPVMVQDGVAIDEIPQATPQEVARMVTQLTSETFDDNRMELAQAMVASKLLTTMDIRRMAGTFTFEDNKLAFAKFAYDFVADPENYYKIAPIFTFSSNKTELLNYIKKNPR